MKRRSFLQSIIGGVAGLFADRNRKTQSEGENEPETEPIWLPYQKEEKIIALGIPFDEIEVYDGEYWTDEQKKRVIKQFRGTLDELCLNAIKGGTTK